jgi:RNA polymerase sigma-70 factor (ECF subfamily)
MTDVDATQFETYRPLLFSIAYRMLGSATDAEDIVQEAYLRYQATAPDQIASPKALLSTIVTRLCLNQLRSAKAQRETYLGPWLPEPVLTDTDDRFAPTQQAELHETLSLAFLVLLEQLTPVERAVFLLRDVFEYDYGEIAAIIGKTEAACRQLFRRARSHIAAHRPRFKPTPDAHQQIFTQFLRAAQSGDLDGLLQLLADDVTLWADSGGKVRGIKRPLRGREVVARFLLASPQIPSESYQPDIASVNGEPAMILRAGSEARVVVSISIDQGRIYAIWVMGNPDKLNWVNGPPHNSEEAAR